MLKITILLPPQTGESNAWGRWTIALVTVSVMEVPFAVALGKINCAGGDRDDLRKSWV